MTTNKEKILVVDDEESVCRLCVSSLQTTGYDVISTNNPLDVIKIVEQNDIDLVLSDITMPGMDGFELLRELKKKSPDIAVIIMTAFSSMDVVINAINDGAYSFIQKPFHLSELLITVKDTLERMQLTNENIRLKTLVNLFSVSEKIGNTLDIPKLLIILLEAVVRETNSDKAVIFYYDEETDELYSKCSLNIDESLTENLRFASNHKIAEAVFNGRKPLLIFRDDNALDVSFIMDKFDNNSMLAVPIYNKNKRFGILFLFKDNLYSIFSKADKDVASILTTQAAVALDNAELLLNYEILFLESMTALVKALDERDPYTHGHSHRVAQIATLLGVEMGLSEKELEDLHYSGIFHDIGKIGIRDDILLKPSSLSTEEYEIIKSHPERGYKIVKPIQDLNRVAEAIYSHHEWYNGNGYPRGLKEDEIPLLGHIIAVADAYDTITTDRIYREHRNHDDAVNIIRKFEKIQFHPEVVAVLDCLKNFKVD